MPIYKTGQQKDGRAQYKVCVNYTDVHGKYRQKSKSVYGLTEAKIAELQLMSEVSESPKDSNITVQKLYNEYMSVKKNEVRLSTLKKSEANLSNHVLPTMKSVRLDKLNSKALQSWKQSIYEKDLLISSRQKIYKEFHAMLNYAVKMDYLNKNPLNAVGNFKEVYFDAPAKDKLHYYTAEEFKKYIAEAAENCTSMQEYGYYVFFNIAFYTGMRKGEINALKWSDIEKDLIHVRRSISQKLGCGDVEITWQTYAHLYPREEERAVKILNELKF